MRYCESAVLAMYFWLGLGPVSVVLFAGHASEEEAELLSRVGYVSFVCG